MADTRVGTRPPCARPTVSPVVNFVDVRDPHEPILAPSLPSLQSDSTLKQKQQHHSIQFTKLGRFELRYGAPPPSFAVGGVTRHCPFVPSTAQNMARFVPVITFVSLVHRHLTVRAIPQT